MNNPQILTQDFNVCSMHFEYFQECHKQEIDSINEEVTFLESNEKPRKRPTFKAKEPQHGKKRKFREQKSFSFADFHEDAKMLSEEWKASEPEDPVPEMILRDMKAEEFERLFES